MTDFQQAVWEYYDAYGRHDLPWRQPEANGQFDAYKIMVSELMLQQTQVPRVIPKYQAFLACFPDVHTLAAAELGDVLRSWQGLGYNRRAKFLWQAAHMIVSEYDASLPQDITQLVKLPGIGANTAGAIVAYAYSQPVVYVETNIRTVYIYHFTDQEQPMHDTEIAQLVKQTLPDDHSLIRAWYWALMDYGTHLKKVHGNLNKLSKSYTKQSPFHGSRRQVRGAIIRELSQGASSYESLEEAINDLRLAQVLMELKTEGLIRQDSNRYSL